MRGRSRDNHNAHIRSLTKMLAAQLLKRSNQIKSGSPSVYELPLEVVSDSEPRLNGICKYAVGCPNSKPERILMLVGATGAGKSTLINGMANYVTGVNWKDSFRFKVIVDEGSKSQAGSQTRNITAYTFYSLEDMPYNLTIIDTPGFGDTAGGIERDKYIANQIKKFFSGRDRGGIDQLHGIGFVLTQSSPLGRLTPPQKYIFDAVLSIFGKDISNNLFLLDTCADAIDPPSSATVKAATIPFKKSFRFNSAAYLFTSTGIDFNSTLWDMGLASFSDLFHHFSRAPPQSLALTREVLQEREQLENLIHGLQQQVRDSISKLDVIEQEESILKQHEADLDKLQQNCLFWLFPTLLPQPAWHFRTILTSGLSTEDRMKLHQQHRPFIGLDRQCLFIGLDRQYQRERYETAKTEMEKVKKKIEENEDMLQNLQDKVFSLIKYVTKCIERLDRIALKLPNPITEIEYINILENWEAKLGWKRRVKYYEMLREEAKILKMILDKQVKMTDSKDRSWWKVWSQVQSP